MVFFLFFYFFFSYLIFLNTSNFVFDILTFSTSLQLFIGSFVSRTVMSRHCWRARNVWNGGCKYILTAFGRILIGGPLSVLCLTVPSFFLVGNAIQRVHFTRTRTTGVSQSRKTATTRRIQSDYMQCNMKSEKIFSTSYAVIKSNNIYLYEI